MSFRQASTHSANKRRNKVKTLGSKNGKISLEVKFIVVAVLMTGLLLGTTYNVDNKVHQIDASREKLKRDFLRSSSNHDQSSEVTNADTSSVSMREYEQLKRDFHKNTGKQEEEDLSMTIITKSDDGIFCACDIVSVDCLDSVNCIPNQATSLTSVATGILIRRLIKKTAKFDGPSYVQGDAIPIGKGFQYKTITAWLSWANENKLPSEHDPSPSYKFLKDAKHKYCEDNNLVGFHCFFTEIKQEEEFDRLEAEALPHLQSLLESDQKFEQHVLRRMQDIQAAVSTNKGNELHAADHLRMMSHILRMLYNRQEPLRELSSKIRVYNRERKKESVTPPLRVSIHVRRADSCIGSGDFLEEGSPLDSIAQPSSLRKCYTTSVYMNALQRLKDMTIKRDPARQIEVFISSDDASSMMDEIKDKFPELYISMTWNIHDIDRDRFNYEGYIDVGDHNNHLLLGEAAAADLWLLSNGEVFIGHLGSRFGKIAYLLATARHNRFIPFFSVDGHSVCCEIDEPCGEMKPFITSMSDCLTFARDHESVAQKGYKMNEDYWEAGSLMRKIIAQGSLDKSRSEEHVGRPMADSKNVTYGLTIAHCKETKMDWLNDVPRDWKVKIYETCGQNISRFSQQFKNAGSEECTAYLSTMIEGYLNDNLPDINIFAQSDVLVGTGRPDQNPHSPFHNFSELVSAVTQWNGGGSGDYLAFGPNILMPIPNMNEKLFYLDYYVRDIFNMMGLNYTSNSTSVRSRAGACFAVTKDRIRTNVVDKFIHLKEEILKRNPDEARKLCCGLENTWHAILGEPYDLPETSTVDHLWKNLEI